LITQPAGGLAFPIRDRVFAVQPVISDSFPRQTNAYRRVVGKNHSLIVCELSRRK